MLILVISMVSIFRLSSAIIYGKYSGLLDNYEVVLPRKVRACESFYSFALKHYFDEGLIRRKRSILDSDHVHYRIKINNTEHHLHLKPNPTLVSPGLLVEHWHGTNLSDHRVLLPTKHLCHYEGHVRGEANSRAAISLCSGIVGKIALRDSHYHIEPIENEDSGGDQLHVVYKRSVKGKNNLICDAAQDWWNSWAEEMYRQIISRPIGVLKKRHSDPREVVPRYMELCVVSDLKFIQHHKTSNVEEYVLSIMNMVADFYHDASIGSLIDVVIVRLVFLHKEKEEMDLDISPNASDTLDSFCKWQVSLNPKDPNHPNHHDLAVLLTRHDICSEGSSACSLLGLAYVGTACSPTKNCCINEDTGLQLSATVAHELGHNMGCAHDSPEESGCEGKTANGRGTVMSPSVGAVWSTTWSSCSKEFISNLLMNKLGECLLDEPKEQNYESTGMPIGAIYDSDQQCKFVFGEDFIRCNIGGENACAQLWCKKVGGKKCMSMGQEVADGTKCGPELWCYNKECVPVGQRPPVVDGSWSEWGSWTQCTRTCGGGVSMRQRLCINPKPENGGRYCTGTKREYTICNTEDCDDNKPSFRDVQCKDHNKKPFKGKLHVWKPHPPPESDPNPCALYCLNEERNFVKLEQRVIDGTRCNPGNKNTCIHGSCIHVGCDWGIESGAVEDICGVCNGDGTRCNVIKKTFIQTKGSGYTKVVTIPKGSTNIAIIESYPSDNMLAIGSPNGSIYLNENYTEKLPGEYKLGGVLAIYTKPEKSREEIHIKGPLKEDIILYYAFFKDENPGIVYKYSVPTSQPAYSPTYHWEFAEWGDCSVKCGGGIQISKPTCVEEKTGKVVDKYCDFKDRPDPKTKSCNLQKCRTRWKTWAWGPCSGCMYKTGERKRDVECVMELPTHGDGDELIVDESECCHSKPPNKELCNSSRPCNATQSSGCSRKKRWHNKMDNTFKSHIYNLSGVEEDFKKFIKRSTGHWLSSNCTNTSVVPIVVDKLDPANFTLKTVNLDECNSDLLGNISEKDFETIGDKIPVYSPGQPEVFKGASGMRKLNEELHSHSKPWKSLGSTDGSHTVVESSTQSSTRYSLFTEQHV